jgi:uncharacterized protein YjiS (DUF1127 family)
MTVIEFQTYQALGTSVWRRLRRALRTALVVMKRRRRLVRAHIELSRLDDRILYDLGLDPLDIRSALDDHRFTSRLSMAARRRRKRQ